jgi:hypothetical protein
MGPGRFSPRRTRDPGPGPSGLLDTGYAGRKRDWRGWRLGWVSALRSKALKPHRECMARPNFLPRRRTRVRMAMLANPVIIFF